MTPRIAEIYASGRGLTVTRFSPRESPCELLYILISEPIISQNIMAFGVKLRL